jgi:hypothetical protein
MGFGVIQRFAIVLIMVPLTLIADGIRRSEAHQDPCHRRHSCPSDQNTYICGDQGHCDQCPDNKFCLAGKPRLTSSSTPTPAPPSPLLSATTAPSAVTVCFTPSGTCTDAIV